MPLPHHFFAPSFRQSRLGWYFTALVGVMVFLASFAMAGEAALSALTYNWDRGMQQRLTVELPAIGDEATVPQAERIQQALAIIRVIPGVASATPVPDSETDKLLAPWIDQPELLKLLPVPALIDVRRNGDVPLTADTIRDRLKSVAPDVKVEDHAVWLASLSRFVRGLALLGALTILLTMLTLILTVSLLCRAIMTAEGETIALLHVMGADDDDIAGHFAAHARRSTAYAALAGFLPALAITGGLIYAVHPLIEPTGLTHRHEAALVASLLIVPLAALIMASTSARRFALGYLQRLP